MPVDPTWAQEAAVLLKVLADPTRLSMMLCLWRAEAPVCICVAPSVSETPQISIRFCCSMIFAAIRLTITARVFHGILIEESKQSPTSLQVVSITPTVSVIEEPLPRATCSG